MIMMKGHPATGKSTLARVLARHLMWPLIDKDDIKDHTLHMPSGNEIAYEVAWQIAETQLAIGVGVVVDTPLSYEIAYRKGCTVAARQGVPFLIVETRLDEKRWRTRFEQRSTLEEPTHKISNWRDMQNLLLRYDGCWEYPIPGERHLVIDTGLPIGRQLDDVLKRLSAEDQRPEG
jgi:predicted kinase